VALKGWGKVFPTPIARKSGKTIIRSQCIRGLNKREKEVGARASDDLQSSVKEGKRSGSNMAIRGSRGRFGGEPKKVEKGVGFSATHSILCETKKTGSGGIVKITKIWGFGLGGKGGGWGEISFLIFP